MPSRRDWDTVVGLVVAAPTLAWSIAIATIGAGRWPWAAFVLAAEVPFLLMLSPAFVGWVRRLTANRRAAEIGAMAVLALGGAVLFAATGESKWYNILLWPICVTVSVLAAGSSRDSEMPPGRLLLTALGIWVLAGLWDWKLQVRSPGDLDIGLSFFAGLDVALFVLLVVRPLRCFDVGLALSGRDLGLALGAVAALMITALPVGFLIGFLQFNIRWNGLEYGASRLFGLVLFVGLPEELLFRGMIQEAFERLWGGRAGWIVASVLFGLTHIVKRAPPLNWRYAILATFAGLAYGWVYQRTRRLAAAAVTHGLVDWIWSSFLLVP